ncbi:MAG TPA: hypothetical protein VI731_05145 [Bacteroidia bacterium]|nr:hypothetical protein [Bacteroidia bacterium]
MAVYRFRISFEDYEDVHREIEVLGKQTYEDFHRAIQEAIGFDNSKEASFFISDDLWRKGLEITSRRARSDDEDERPRLQKVDVRDMNKSKIADHIEDPHQRLVYVFDPLAKWTLLIELAKIVNDDPKVNYPRTSRSTGTPPKQYKVKLTPPPEEEEEVEDDEEDKKAKEKVFTAVEALDVDEPLIGDIANEEGETESETEEEGNGEGEEENGGNEFEADSGRDEVY